MSFPIRLISMDVSSPKYTHCIARAHYDEDGNEGKFSVDIIDDSGLVLEKSFHQIDRGTEFWNKMKKGNLSHFISCARGHISMFHKNLKESRA